MNCFNHRDKPAIGLCKSCLKGLCEDCLAEVHNGLVCKGSCEEQLNAINRMLDNSTQALGAARQKAYSVGIMTLLMGIGFEVFAVWSYSEYGSSFLPYMLGFIGMCMLISGIPKLGRKERLPKLVQEKS